MQKKDIFALALMAFGVGWSASMALAQQSDAPLPSAPMPTPSAASKPDKSKAPPAPAPSTENSAPDSSQSQAPQTPAQKPSTAADNPFPEEVSKQAAAAAAKDAATNAATPNVPSPGNPTPGAKSPSDSSSLDNMDKLGLDDPARKRLKLESPDGSTGVYDPKRATEDVKVGKFYLQTGHYKGAYDRFKDATVFDHENVEAVFYLAEAARKLNLEKEAEQDYQLYLAAVPDGGSAKAARKALGELGAASKP